MFGNSVHGQGPRVATLNVDGEIDLQHVTLPPSTTSKHFHVPSPRRDYRNLDENKKRASTGNPRVITFSSSPATLEQLRR